MPTLTVAEILKDVLKAFKVNFPALNRMGTNFRVGQLKLGNTYYAHIPTVPVVNDVTTTYAVAGQTARSLLVDVPVVVNKHKAVLLTFSHFAAIADQKNEYDQCIANAGYALAKACIDDILSAAIAANFSQSSVFTTADCDADMLIDVCSDMNAVGAAGNGRVLLLNSAASASLSADARMASRDFQGQIQGGDAYRTWRNAYGWAEIIEYPGLPTTGNMCGFGFDPRAIALVAGVPDDSNQEFLRPFNIPEIMTFESISDPDTGLTMAMVGWQTPATAEKNLAVTMVWGKTLGKNGGSAGTITDYAGHIVKTA